MSNPDPSALIVTQSLDSPSDAERDARDRRLTQTVAAGPSPVMFPAYRAVKEAMAGEGGPAADAGFVQGQLHTCDAIVVKSLLKQVVEANTSPILGTIKVHRVGDVTDYMAIPAAINATSGSEPARQTTPPDENMLRVRAALENRRMCGARLFTSRGQHLWNYTVVWTSAAKDEIFVQAEFGD